MVAFATLAIVAFLLVGTVGESAAVVEMGISALVDGSEALATGLGWIGRLIDRIGGTAASVSVGLIFTNGQRIAVVLRVIAAFVHVLLALSTRLFRIIRLVLVAVSASTSVLLRSRHFRADGRWMAVVLRRIDAHVLETDSSRLVSRARRLIQEARFADALILVRAALDALGVLVAIVLAFGAAFVDCKGCNLNHR